MFSFAIVIAVHFSVSSYLDKCVQLKATYKGVLSSLPPQKKINRSLALHFRVQGNQVKHQSTLALRLRVQFGPVTCVLCEAKLHLAPGAAGLPLTLSVSAFLLLGSGAAASLVRSGSRASFPVPSVKD